MKNILITVVLVLTSNLFAQLQINLNHKNSRIESGMLFNNLIWLTSDETAFFLRKSVGALRTMVSRGHISCKKWHHRLYFRRDDLEKLLNSSLTIEGGLYGN